MEALYIKRIAARLSAVVEIPKIAVEQPAAATEESAPLPKPVSASNVLGQGTASAQAGTSVPRASEDQTRTTSVEPVNGEPSADTAGGTRTTAVSASAEESADLRLEFPAPTRTSALEASPDGRWLAVGTSFGDVFVADTTAGKLTRLVSVGEGSIDELAWSSDSQWLVWSEPVTSFGSRSKLRIARPAEPESGIIDVTDGRFCDESPKFTPDGKFLAFLSNRSFDPVYDGHSFDLSFPSPHQAVPGCFGSGHALAVWPFRRRAGGRVTRRDKVRRRRSASRAR